MDETGQCPMQPAHAYTIARLSMLAHGVKNITTYRLRRQTYGRHCLVAQPATSICGKVRSNISLAIQVAIGQGGAGSGYDTASSRDDEVLCDVYDLPLLSALTAQAVRYRR